MPRAWRRVGVPLLSGGEQSAAAPEGYAPGEAAILRNALMTGPGVLTQQPDWLRVTTLRNLSGEEAHACVGCFPFETAGDLSASQAIAFTYNDTDNTIYLHHIGEDFSVMRTLAAYTSYTETQPPQITGFEMFSKFYFCDYAQNTAAVRKGFSYYDPLAGGSVTTPTFEVVAGGTGAAALRFRGITRHRGATILGWGYQSEEITVGEHWLRNSKYGEPGTWIADNDETTAGFILVGTTGMAIVGCARSGRYTIIGKPNEIFALDGDYSSQFHYDQIGGEHGPLSTVGITSIGTAAVWMSDEGPAISGQGGRVELLGLDKVTRRFLNYMDLNVCSAVHDARNTRVLFALRRKLDDNGNVVDEDYLTELLAWDYKRNAFIPSDLPAPIWALGRSRGPGLDLAAPSGVVSAITATEITSHAALIGWTPGDTAPDVTFDVQYRQTGDTDWIPTVPLQTGQALYEYRLSALDVLTNYDVRVRQVRNSQASAWVESLALFWTLSSGEVADPVNLDVAVQKIIYWTKYDYTYPLLTWDAHYAHPDVVLRLYAHTANAFSAATMVLEVNPKVGRANDPTTRIVTPHTTGFSASPPIYYWAREENDTTGITSRATEATTFPLRFLP
jgi:hypothetical protein